MRQIDFNDSFSSATSPNLIQTSAGKLNVYVDDAAYVSAKGSAAAEGDLYWNSTLDDIKFYTGTEWKRNESELNNSTTADPTVNDDSDDGYEVLSLWLNTSSGDLFRCTDATVGAAAWEKMAADAELALHIADTSTHGVGLILGSTEAQTVSNKSIQTPSRLDCKQDTLANLITYALTATNGQFCFATDVKKYYQVLDGALVEIGSGSGVGSFSIYGALDADTTDYTDFDVTNITNATFGEESSTPLSGAKSYLFTNVTGAVNEYIITPAQTVQKRSNDKYNSVTFPYRYDGDADDIKAIFYDETNSAVIKEVNLEAASVTKNITLDGYVLNNVASVSLRLEILVVNNGKKLIFDDIVFSDDPFTYKDFYNATDWESYTPTFTGLGTTTNNNIYYRRDGGDLLIIGSTTSGTVDASAVTMTLPTGLNLDTNQAVSQRSTLGRAQRIASGVNQSGGAQECHLMYYSADGATKVSFSRDNSDGLTMAQTAGSSWMTSNESFTITARIPIEDWEAKTEHYVTPREGIKEYSEANGDFTTSGTNWTVNRAIALPYITQSGAWRCKFNIVGNTSVAATGLDLTVSGITFKNVSSYYQAMSASTVSANQSVNVCTIPNSSDIRWRVDNGTNPTLWCVSGDVELESKPTWASESSAQYMAAVPTQKTVYLKDVKSSGTGGGTSTSTTWHTRTLNTVEGDTEIVSLSSNQFTLGVGKYEITASAPTYIGDHHQIKLVKDPSGTPSDEIIGESSYHYSGSTGHGRSALEGVIEITESTTFEIQHYIESGFAGRGLGEPASTGVGEVYTSCKITKLITS